MLASRPTPASSAIPTPSTSIVRLSEEELGQLAAAIARLYGPLVTAVTANVRSDAEVYSTFHADLCLGDTLSESKVVKGTTVGVEGQELGLTESWQQFCGLLTDLRSSPRGVHEPVGAVPESLEGAVGVALNGRWAKRGWLHLWVETDDVARWVTPRDE
jgi:hypothetical protein